MKYQYFNTYLTSLNTSLYHYRQYFHCSNKKEFNYYSYSAVNPFTKPTEKHNAI